MLPYTLILRLSVLFKRIFNWLKLKSITPSALYRNRLFIERDSKKRRVMSNFGLTFRNSKWTDYALNNVSLKSIEKSKALLFNIFFIILLLLTINYVLCLSLKVQVISLPREVIWLIYDWTTLTLAFTLVSYKNVITTLARQGVLVFWNYVFGVSISNEPSTGLSQPTTLKAGSASPLDVTSSRNITLTTLLLTTSQSTLQSNQILLDLYSQSNATNHHTNFLKFYKKLYTLNNQIQQVGTEAFLSKPLVFNQKITNPVTLITNPEYAQYFNVTLNYYIRTLKPSSTTPAHHIDLSKWSLRAEGQEVANTQSLLKNTQGLFYLTNISNQKLNHSLFESNQQLLWQNTITQQTQFFKWLRWMYRYNILHRNVIKSSQKIQGVKKLLSSGFYTSDITKTNIWISNSLNNSPEQVSLRNTWLTFYNRFFNLNSNQLTKVNNWPTLFNRQSLVSLRFYEDSYFFTLHRFINFNTLSKIEISSNFTLKRSRECSDITSRSAIQSTTLVNFLLKSNSFVQNSYSFYKPQVSLSSFVRENQNNVSTLENLSMTTLLETHKNLLSDKTTLELLQVLNSNLNSSSNQSLIFTYSPVSNLYDVSELWEWSSAPQSYQKQQPTNLDWLDAQFTADIWKWLRCTNK